MEDRIAIALGSSFRCYDCQRWRPTVEAAEDVRWDEEHVVGIRCWACRADFERFAATWMGREIA